MRAGWKWTKQMAGLIVALAGLAASSHGAGLLVADGGFGGVLEIVEHDVQVTINNGVAVTRVAQTFLNTERRQVEALYTFPVPRGASVANFSMWINGKEMVGEVLEKERAREIYNSYKRRKRDPGLLEQADYRTFEMRIFPIGAGATQRVEIAYYQELEADHDRLTYVYPLATSARVAADSRVSGRFAMNVEIKSAVPLVEVASPSHPEGFAMATHSADLAQASLESRDGSLARDVVITCRLQRPRTGLDLITSKEDGQDGYFLLTLTAGDDLGTLDAGMDYVFVMDISGSMGNDSKLSLSKQSVEAFLHALGAEDRFEVLAFNVQPTVLFRKLEPAGEEALRSAGTFLAGQSARGGTVLNSAMTLAYSYADPDRPLNVVILSDGMTEQSSRRELLTMIQQRPRNTKVFCIGIGNDVNRPLLEQIAEDSGGLASFVSRGDDFKRQAQAFRRKLTRPAATDLKIRFTGVDTYDMEPAVLPNLYHGSPIRVYGRYRGSGTARVEAEGDIRGIAFRQAADLELPARDEGNPQIERMWAWKRVDRLLKSADRSGSRQEVVSEVIALGETYSIVTEYTSFLVLENDGEYRRWKIERRNARRWGRDREAQENLRRQWEEIRRKAVTDLGPVADGPAVASRQAPAASPAQPNVVSRPDPGGASQPSSQSWDLGLGGTGPVGPLFALWALWMRRRAKQQRG